MPNPSDDKAVSRERVATIRVTARVDWLTNDGEESEEAGWEELARRLERHLGGFYNLLPAAAVPNLSFIEWIEDDPETP